MVKLNQGRCVWRRLLYVGAEAVIDFFQQHPLGRFHFFFSLAFTLAFLHCSVDSRAFFLFWVSLEGINFVLYFY